MNENSKTISLIVAAAVVLLVAFFSRPSSPSTTADSIVGKSLFPELDDPLKAKRMRIVTFDETAGKAKEFEVAQVNGVWSLPSHKNYPADAKEQMTAAATALVDLKVIAPRGNSVADHELYGVTEPKPTEDQFGQQGIGKLVSIEDDAGKPLARIIVGKQDKQTKPDEMGAGPQMQLRFVRKPGQDQVYLVQMKADKFSTKFQDWIETDLLKLSPWDITDIQLKDYSVIDAVTQTGERAAVLEQRSDADIAFDDKTNKWTLKGITEYVDNKPQTVKITESEEVNATKLNDLKNALANLKIIDVAHKPTQMSANLKADKEFINDSEAIQDLRSRGFRPRRVGDDFDIVSSDGEAIVRMKDGVEYVLRFGKVAGIESGEDEKKDDEAKGDKADAKGKSEEKAADKKDSGGLSRYIMVMARYNPDVIAKPELEPLPEIKKAAEKSGEKAADKKGDSKAADAKAADSKAADKKGVTAKGDAKTDAKDAKKDAPKAGDAKKDEAKKDEAKKDESKAADSADDDQEAREAERDRVEKENRRKQDAYDDQVKKAQQHAKDLNSRFADWYYVVGDETYHKIHLGKDDIVQKKPAKDAAKGESTTPNDPFNIPGLQGMPVMPSPAGKK